MTLGSPDGVFLNLKMGNRVVFANLRDFVGGGLVDFGVESERGAVF